VNPSKEGIVFGKDAATVDQSRLNLGKHDLKGRRVFLRVDFNVPVDASGTIIDDSRLIDSLHTINYLRGKEAKVILAAHLGRPKNRVLQSCSLRPVARRLSELIGIEVSFLPQCVGPEVAAAKEHLKSGDVILLENLRFNPGEAKNSKAFSEELAESIDLYVNEAMSVCHRDHASITGVPRVVPEVAAGFGLLKELSAIKENLWLPARPFVAMIGGGQIAEKIGLIRKMLEKADRILIGGAPAYTFLKAKNIDVGSSLVDPKSLEICGEILDEADDLGVEILLPVDNVVARKESDDIRTSIVRNENIPSTWMALDIGPETVKLFAAAIAEANTVFWNGPMGAVEKDLFQDGTREIARAISAHEGRTFIAGNDSIAAVRSFGLEKAVSHLSNGGCATLAILQGKILPGLAVLKEKG
jgi:phosphoglycerate kinase